MPKRKRGLPDIASLLEGGFNEETARLLYAQGEEIAIFVMMQLARRDAQCGHRAVVLSAFLHYFVGTTISQIITIFAIIPYFGGSFISS